MKSDNRFEWLSQSLCCMKTNSANISNHKCSSYALTRLGQAKNSSVSLTNRATHLCNTQWGRGWPLSLKPRPSHHMCYHAEFGLFSPNGVGIIRGTPKIGSLWPRVPPLGTEGVPDPYKHAAPHVGNYAEVDRCSSADERLSPCKVTHVHRNGHGSIRYLRLPDNVLLSMDVSCTVCNIKLDIGQNCEFF